MNWTIPNILTVARLVSAPLIALAFLVLPRPMADGWALGIFIVASLTDYVDGYLARAWGQESLFGAAMDPIADKATVLIALMVIVGYAGVTGWILLPATVIIYREVFVSGLRETLGDRARALKVTDLAKWKTTVQMFALGFLLGGGLFTPDGAGVVTIIGIILIWAAGVLTLITGIDYFRKAMPFLRESPDA